ncbi:RloB family protein [Pseudodesulfovibrio thermohalotolerans]|uniref:RloB family protein n=1 Tax=Pseudodesulfovibrio thermohalotolerans TaxID=2880651 RepID=UPI002442FEBC|nr:RloB family protein [Pseudodesulfovibrio thermohalotolerans]WFS63964.1 RloB family protein [Pseudodesulfovibrio thermohalotolerans]
MARPRKKATRPIFPSIFIFCEGKKTEPNYFRALINSLNFPGELAKVKVIDSDKTNLVGLVNEAKELKKNNRYGIVDDEYWIVVDKDGYTMHAQGFDQALANSFNIAFSSVCFEFWILCHFTYTTAQKAKCEKLIKEQLEANIPNYEKNQIDIYDIIKMKQNNACAAAKRIRKHWEAVGEGKPIYELNPYTDVDRLVEKLVDYSNELKNK